MSRREIMLAGQYLNYASETITGNKITIDGLSTVSSCRQATLADPVSGPNQQRLEGIHDDSPSSRGRCVLLNIGSGGAGAPLFRNSRAENRKDLFGKQRPDVHLLRRVRRGEIPAASAAGHAEHRAISHRAAITLAELLSPCHFWVSPATAEISISE